MNIDETRMWPQLQKFKPTGKAQPNKKHSPYMVSCSAEYKYNTIPLQKVLITNKPHGTT
jgi:hypothetical protein